MIKTPHSFLPLILNLSTSLKPELFLYFFSIPFILPDLDKIYWYSILDFVNFNSLEAQSPISFKRSTVFSVDINKIHGSNLNNKIS